MVSEAARTTNLPKIDMHVHLLSNGKTGSGCRATVPCGRRLSPNHGQSQHYQSPSGSLKNNMKAAQKSLATHINNWVGDGLITQDQADRILAKYPAASSSPVIMTPGIC